MIMIFQRRAFASLNDDNVKSAQVVVARDTDWETKMVWTRTNVITGESNVQVEYKCNYKYKYKYKYNYKYVDYKVGITKNILSLAGYLGRPLRCSPW